jgi:hypothetical protein
MFQGNSKVLLFIVVDHFFNGSCFLIINADDKHAVLYVQFLK